MPDVPLPFTVQHQAYRAGVKDANGNPKPDWAPPVARACFWWDPDSAEPLQGPTGGATVVVDRVLVLDVAVVVDHRDRFFWGDQRYDAIGLPKDFNHGPFGYAPNRLVVQLRGVR